MNNGFLGNNFNWFFGRIISRDDPLKANRHQIRIYGTHSDDTNKIKNDDLPWAQILNTDNSFKTYPENSLIVGFFLDQHKQYPLILGKLDTIEGEEPKDSSGFSDPRTKDQLENSPSKPKSLKYNNDGSGVEIENGTATKYNYINEPSIPRIFRNEKLESNSDKVTNSEFSEPDSSYNAKYPYNSGKETESGHSFQMDDTKGSERVELKHRSGTNFSYNPDGTKVEKVTKDNYEIIYGNDFVQIMGTVNVIIGSDAKMTFSKSLNMKVDGEFNIDATKVNVTGDVIGKGVSLFKHGHTLVTSGDDISGPPLPGTGSASNINTNADFGQQLLDEYNG